MTDHADPLVAEQPPDKPRRSVRGHSLLAWTAIGLVLATMAGLNVWSKRIAAAPSVGDRRSDSMSLEGRSFNIQAQYIIGAAELLPVSAEMLIAKLKPEGSVRNQIRHVALVGIVAGPKKAEERYDALVKRIDSSGVEVAANDRELLDALSLLYSDYRHKSWDAPSLTSKQRELLEQKLGWVGQLALAPKKSSEGEEGERRRLIAAAQRTALLLILAFCGFTLLTLLGVGAAIGLLLHAGRIRSKLEILTENGPIYLETFAIWLAVYFFLQVAAGLILSLGSGVTLYTRLWVALTLTFVAFTAVVWPWVRGVGGGLTRREVGLTTGRNVLFEMACGIACYVTSLPFLLLSIIAVALLMHVRSTLTGEAGNPFSTPNQPNHPIADWIPQADFATRAIIAVIATVAAPIVEETMFRGYLYRSLRESTMGLRLTTSVLASGLIGSLIFAVIHPQGLLGIPPLMTLALAFSLVREFRGSLIAPITAHALNNGLMTLFMFSLFG